MNIYPKISIVTPSFNQGRFLEKTILSVIEQDYPNLEYIIIDGGSTDESVEIIKKYEKHLTYWVSEPDRGQSHAINKGFERATGEIFGWLNSDDWYHPGALKAVAEAFDANSDAGAVVGAGDYVDEDGKVIVTTFREKVNLDTLCSWFDNYFWQPSCLFRKNVWEQCGPLDESLDLSMDLDLWIKIAKKFRFISSDKLLSHNLRHSSAKTTMQMHRSDLMTLKLILNHAGLEAFDKILPSYVERLTALESGYRQQMEEERRSYATEIAGIKRELSRVEEEKAAILNSMSWKITQPLRKAGDLVKAVGIGPTRHIRSSYQPEIFFDRVSLHQRFDIPVCAKPRVSIIIPVHNQWAYTHSCIYSIQQNTEGIDYEIIVADDASTDATCTLGEIISNVRVIKNEQSLGFLRNCNKAASFAQGEYLLILNNDVNVQKNWLKHLLETAESDSKVGIVGAKLIYPDGTLQEAGGIVWNDGTAANYGRGDDPSKPEYNYLKECDYVSGACLLVSRDLWNQLGGFDDRFAPAYCEDTDLSFMARKAGYKVIYQPKSVVVHFEGKSHGTDINKGIKQYQVHNQIKFREKWASILHDENESLGQLFTARDRSKHKKTVVFVDYEVPHFDMFAGSRTNYLYLKLLVNMGFNVKLLPANFIGDEPYSTVFNQLGIEVLYGELFKENWKTWIVENSDYIDYVFFNKPEPTCLFIDFIKSETGAKIIYQCHDLHYLRLTRKFELEGNQADRIEADRYKKMEYEIFSKSDVILTFSSVEKSIIEEKVTNKPVVVVPLYFYEKMKEEKIDFSNRAGLLYVGGFGHAPNVDAVLWFVMEIFPHVVKSIPDIIFYVVGNNPPNQIKALSSKNIKLLGQVSDSELTSLYEKVRLIVIPLRFGAGVKGKTIEALYHGVPMVATNIAIEGIDDICSVIEPTDDPTEFANKIVKQYDDIEALMSKSEVIREFVKNKYSYSATACTIKKIFMET